MPEEAAVAGDDNPTPVSEQRCTCPPARRTPSQIRDQLSSWWSAFWVWNVLHYALGLVATIGSVLVVQQSKIGTGASDHQTLGVVVAVCTAALTFLKSGAKANAYIAAWRYLNAERICYELDATYTDTKLAEHHKKAEAIISKSD
jgi:hypothetical protein